MKKYLAMILALVMALSLVACGDKKDDSADNSDGDTASGRVYWLNFKPEADEALQKVAAMYTEKTGVPVTVVTAASGTYNETLTAEMDKSAPPTLFVVGNQAAVGTWGDYCYDLSGTAVANELNTDAYNLYDADGKLCSIGYCYEALHRPPREPRVLLRVRGRSRRLEGMPVFHQGYLHAELQEPVGSVHQQQRRESC